MKFFWASILTAIAVVATVALNPTSRWTLTNAVEQLAGKWQLTQSFGPSALSPLWLDEANAYSGSGRDIELTRAILSLQHGSDEQLFDYVKRYPSDVLGWSLVAAHKSGEAQAIDATHPIKQKITRQIQQALDLAAQQAITACENGHRLDPENSFFPLMEAAAQMNRGDRKRSLALLHQAAACRTYSDRFSEINQVRMQTVIEIYGYRGEYVQLLSASSLFFPHMSTMANYFRNIGKSATLQTRVDLIRVSDLLARHGDSAIGVFVASRGLYEALEVKPLRLQPIPPSKVLSAAIDLQNKADAAHMTSADDLVEATRRIEKLRNSVMQMLQAQRDEAPPSSSLFTSALLLACLLVVLPLGLISLWATTAMDEDFKGYLPHLISFIALVAAFAFNPQDSAFSAILGGFGCAQVLMIFLRAPARVARIASILVLIGAVGVTVYTTSNWWFAPIAVPCVVFAIGYFIACKEPNRDLRKRWAELGGILIVGVSSLAAFLWISALASLLGYAIGFALASYRAPLRSTKIAPAAFSAVIAVLGVLLGLAGLHL